MIKNELIQVKAMYSENTLEIDINNSQDTYLHTTQTAAKFTTKNDIFDILRKMDDGSSVKTIFPNSNALIEKTRADGFVDNFYLYYTPEDAEGNSYYFLTSLCTGLVSNNESSQEQNVLLMPTYMFESTSLYQNISRGEARYEMKKYFDYDDIREFYERSGWFLLEQEENKLVLMGFTDVLEQKLHYQSQRIFPIVFSFEDIDGITYCEIR